MHLDQTALISARALTRPLLVRRAVLDCGDGDVRQPSGRSPIWPVRPRRL